MMTDLKRIAPTSVVNELYRCGTIVLVFLLIVFTHPFVIGLPGRIGEARFERSLRAGMTRDQVLRLWSVTGDRSAPTDDGRNALGFSFTDVDTICVRGGKHFSVQFGQTMKVQSWVEKPWSIYC